MHCDPKSALAFRAADELVNGSCPPKSEDERKAVEFLPSVGNELGPTELMSAAAAEL